MGAKAVTCYSSAAAFMKGPPGYFTSGAFSNLRWTTAGDQRDERMRIFVRKLLKRLDGMEMPFYPALGLMDYKTAQQRFVTGASDVRPMENPYLDGYAIKFAHCIHRELPAHCWELFAEIAFDVAKLAQIPIAWGGFSYWQEPGVFIIVEDPNDPPRRWYTDRKTYGCRSDHQLRYEQYRND